MLCLIRIVAYFYIMMQCLADRSNGFCSIECVKNSNIVSKTLVPCFVASSIKKCKVEVLKEK